MFIIWTIGRIKIDNYRNYKGIKRIVDKTWACRKVVRKNESAQHRCNERGRPQDY